MKKLLIAPILIFLSMACTSQPDYSKLLVQADSLMSSRPDSALHILQDITLQQFASQADKAYYALLLTQARDKNYIPQTDDSLIQRAVQYYDSTNDRKMQAQAYYHWGSVFRDQNEYSKAISKYITALSYIASQENPELQASLYSNIGYLYYVQGLSAEADSIYHQAEMLALQQSDTLSLCYALTQQGMINLEKGREYYPKAEQRMLQALEVGQTFSDSCTVLTTIYSSLSALYNSIPDTTKALLYSRLNYFTQKDTLHCYRAFLYLGNSYFLNAQYDSASLFLQKILTADRYYDTKADACMRLSEIAQIKGDMELSAILERERATYLDSARINQQHIILNTVNSNMHSSNKMARIRNSYITTGIMGVLIIMGVIIISHFWKKDKRYKTEKKEWEEKIQDKIDLPLLTVEELAKTQSQKLQLQEEVKQLTLKKQAYAKEEYKTSAVYVKVRNIAKELIRTETKENLSEEEWNQFMSLTNAGWNGIITYLNENYNLSTEELQICCLYLAQVPVKHMGHFVKRQVRSTIQSKSKEILIKIKAPQGILLKNALVYLAEKIENKE